jgi:hypothetical protein
MQGTNNQTQQPDESAIRVYFIGAIAGTLLGFLGSYLYARSVEDERSRSGQVEPMKPFDLLLIAGSVLALLRQIAELSSKSKK